MTTPTTKPVVRYAGEAFLPVGVGGNAWLTPMDHPNHIDGHEIENGRTVRTSTVLAHDPATGRVETRNTVYLPAEARRAA